MKVCWIVSNFPRFAGDAESPWLVEMVRRLRQRGVDMQVLCPAYRGLGSHTFDDIPVHRFRYFPSRWENLTQDEGAANKVTKSPLAKMFGVVRVVPYIAAGSWATTRLLSEGDFDLVHVHWPFPHGLMSSIGARTHRTRTVFSFYGSELSLLAQFGYLRPLMRRIVEDADGVVAISHYVAQRVKQLSPGAAPVIIPYGSPVEEWHGAQESRTRCRILYVGKLIDRKGVRYLIEAMPMVLQRADAHLIIIGSGILEARLKQLTEDLHLTDYVQFLGRAPQDVLEEEYRRCDVFVLPSIVDYKGDTEGLGVVLLEALAHHKPVVASRVGGIVDVVEDGRSGLLVPEKDPRALAEAIARLLADPVLARQLADEGLRRAREYFNWDRIIDELVAVYEAALSGHSASAEVQARAEH